MKPQNRPDAIRIGELACEAGCSVPTIRYYEQIGLIPRAVRSSSRQRLYRSGSIELLRFIRRCREFGFTVDQIRGLVLLTNNTDRNCIEVRDIASMHLARVRKRLSELKSLELTLSRFIAACNSTTCVGSPAPDCTIVKALSEKQIEGGDSARCCGLASSDTVK